VPYPIGFIHQMGEGRIDDANAGWKAEAVDDLLHETIVPPRSGKENRPKVVRFQLRPDPAGEVNEQRDNNGSSRVRCSWSVILVQSTQGCSGEEEQGHEDDKVQCTSACGGRIIVALAASTQPGCWAQQNPPPHRQDFARQSAGPQKLA